MSGYPNGFQYGGTVFPVPATTANQSLLASCDPALAKLIDFFEWRINRYLGTALTAASLTPPITKNVMNTISVDWQTVSRSEQVRFPLLAVWRIESTKIEYKSTEWQQDVGRIGWAYVLPPMTLEQGKKFSHVCRSVSSIVHHSLLAGHDPAYNNDERILVAGNIMRARPVSVRYGTSPMGDETDTHFWGVFGVLEVTERTQPYTEGVYEMTHVQTVVTDDGAQPGNPIDFAVLETEQS